MVSLVPFSPVYSFAVPFGRKSKPHEKYEVDNVWVVDPETKAELEELQRDSPLAKANPATALQNFDLAGWMAGKTSGVGAAAAEAGKSTGSSAHSGSSGGSKRRA